MTDRLGELSAAGVAVWLDDISRERLSPQGSATSLASLVKDFHVVGVTSNPTIFANALAASDEYAEQMRDLAARKVTIDEASRMITTYDVRWACDAMRPAYDASGGLDGRVSIEVDPRLAMDTVATQAEAKQLWWLVDRENLFIKIPATEAGLPAITDTLAHGICVNVTLIFSLERYNKVLDAWLSGLEKAKENGHDISKIYSVGSFFVSRFDVEIDKRLEAIGTPEALALRGKGAIANARLAYKAWSQVMASDRWQALKAAGANTQRPLWASTGTKNPDYSDVLYIEELIAPDTVNTMPEKTMKAFADHGTVPGDTITPNIGDAEKTMADLKSVGIDIDDVFDVLEQEGVEKFAKSWEELHDSITKGMGAA
jgi:transaldolase